jgi:site-specific DNA recombinase
VGSIDYSTPSGEMNARMLGVVAHFESQHKAERIRAAHRQLAENGQWHGGIRCFGYEPDGMTIRESEAAEIRRVADAVIAGQSLRSLALELNERGIQTVKGNKWASNYLSKMLKRPRLAGLRVHQGKVIGKGAWEPVLERETWEALKAVLEDPRRRTGGSGRRGPIPTTLGSGLYVCGVCHEPRLRLGQSNARRPVYKCGNVETSSQGHVTRVADKLDAYVEGALLEVISQPGVVAALCNVVDNDDEDLSALRTEQATIRPRLNKLAMRLGDPNDNSFDEEQIAIASKMLRDRDNEITATLTQASMHSPLEILLGVDNIERAWDDELTLGQKRAILAEVLTITVLPTTGGGRAPDGSYFNQDAVRIEQTELARSALST